MRDSLKHFTKDGLSLVCPVLCQKFCVLMGKEMELIASLGSSLQSKSKAYGKIWAVEEAKR